MRFAEYDDDDDGKTPLGENPFANVINDIAVRYS